jgi:hypothetical protein
MEVIKHKLKIKSCILPKVSNVYKDVALNGWRKERRRDSLKGLLSIKTGAAIKNKQLKSVGDSTSFSIYFIGHNITALFLECFMTSLFWMAILDQDCV